MVNKLNVLRFSLLVKQVQLFPLKLKKNPYVQLFFFFFFFQFDFYCENMVGVLLKQGSLKMNQLKTHTGSH